MKYKSRIIIFVTLSLEKLYNHLTITVMLNNRMKETKKLLFLSQQKSLTKYQQQNYCNYII